MRAVRRFESGPNGTGIKTMTNEELAKKLKEFEDRLNGLLDTLAGFETVLYNHMTEYAIKQKSIQTEVISLKKVVHARIRNLSRWFQWGFGVIFGLLAIILGGLITGAVMLLKHFLEVG